MNRGEWDALLASMAKVKRSTHLLAWYVCDDCDNGIPYPLDGMAKVYTALKGLDRKHPSNLPLACYFPSCASKKISERKFADVVAAFHAIMGAPWSEQWSVSVWFENGGGELSMDVPQVRSCAQSPCFVSRFGLVLDPCGSILGYTMAVGMCCRLRITSSSQRI